jgi:hypothetical protein
MEIRELSRMVYEPHIKSWDGATLVTTWFKGMRPETFDQQLQILGPIIHRLQQQDKISQLRNLKLCLTDEEGIRFAARIMERIRTYGNPVLRN